VRTTGRRLFLGVIVLWLMASRTGHAVNPTIFVDRFDDVAGLPCTAAANDCSLRSAVQLANVTPGPDSIVLQAGTYTLTLGPADDDSTGNGAVVTSGDLDIFDSDGDPNQTADLTINGAGLNVTIIQAGPSAGGGIDRIFDVENVYGSPSAEGLNFTLANLTLRYGLAPAIVVNGNTFNETGGAINFNGCRFTVTDCASRGVLTLADISIEQNTATGSGGGVFVQNIGGLTLTGVFLSANTSTGGAGGGLFHLGSPHDGSIVISASPIRGALFASNIASSAQAGSGGALRLGPIAPTSTVSITGATFRFNTSSITSALGGGALSIENSRAITIDSCSFANNSAARHGGAVFSKAAAVTDVVTFVGTFFSSNETTGGDGGGVFVSDGEVRILNGLFVSNKASNGGAVAVRSIGGDPNLTVRNTTLTGNQASAFGGALFLDNSFSGGATLTNVTIDGNYASTANPGAPGGFGGGLAKSAGSLILQNTIVGGNFKGLASNVADDGKATAGVTADYSLIQTTSNFTFAGSNNIIGQSPRLGPLGFHGASLGIMSLLPGSPALDAGSNVLATAAGLTTDQRGTGFSRILDAADANTVDTVDIGAFEAEPSVQDIPDLAINEDSALGISFEVGDADLGFTSITASSSNVALVPNANILLGGSGSTRFLTLTPAANQSGTTTITVRVFAGTSGPIPGILESMTDTFVLTVNPVDDPPVAASVTVPAFPQDSGAHTVGLSATDPDSTTLTFSIVTPPSKGTLGAIGAAACSGSPTTCTATVSYTPNGCAVGSDSFTYRAIDATGGGAPATVNLTMTATTPPSITQHPSNVSVPSTYYATFQAAADGGNPAVQWQVSATSGATWTDIVGATSTTYSFVTALGDSGKWFRAVFTNSVSSAVTNPATLTVIPHGPPDRADFTGDGKADIVWQHPDTGAVLLWEMNGSTYVGSTMLNAGGTLWQIVGVGDFTGDGKADLLWQHPATGAVLLWEMNGTAYVSSTMLNAGGTLWKVVAVADMNGDGQPDVIWQHPDTGAVLLWIMNGATYSSGIVLNAGGTLWKVVGAADFTGDGHPDLLWQDAATGAVLLWTMNGATYAGSTLVNPGGTLWKIVANGDYTGDGKVDVLWQLPSTGALLLWQMNDATYVGSISVTNGGTLWTVKGPR